MKKIINGKKYNTETAREMGSYWNGCGRGDFNFYAETLYKKKTGEFFIHVDGGANTSAAVHAYGAWYGGEKIIPVSAEKAKKWGEKYLSVDEYEKIWGIVAE